VNSFDQVEDYEIFGTFPSRINYIQEKYSIDDEKYISFVCFTVSSYFENNGQMMR